MSSSVFRSRASLDKTVTFGGFGAIAVHAAFDITITIFDSPVGSQIGTLNCSLVSTPTASFHAQEDSGTGGGFWNAAGVMWDGPYTNQFHSLSDAAYDSENRMQSEMNAFTNTELIWFGFRDTDATGSTFTTYPRSGSQYTKNLTTSDLDSSGNLKRIKIAHIYLRWYEWDIDEPRSVVWLNETLYTDQIDVDWKYYPWGRKVSSDWKSCNRDYNTPAGSRIAYLRHKENGNWINGEVLNSMIGSSQNSWRKQGGSWKVAQPYGNY